MFLDIPKFTGILKSAYKNSGLTIGYLNEGLVVSSGYWIIWLRAENIPNKIKALVVELCGFIPESQMMFYISKDNPNPQYKIETADRIQDMIEDFRDADKKLHITPVVLLEGFDVRLLQTPTRVLVGMNEAYFGIIDPSNVDYGQESMPTGPCFREAPETGIYWHNENCIVIVFPAKVRNTEVAEALQKVDFNVN
ncbi:MAG TPA: hypothetical protein VN549_00680 [Negativicutes bacterium]|nr:hypothetical protein [Negativicutes bacterium]